MLVGGALATNIVQGPDKRHQDEFFRDNEDSFHPVPLYSYDFNSVAEAAGFQSPWWPFRGAILGGWGFDGSVLLELGGKHSDTWRSFGTNGRLAFVGVTRDQYGSPLGGCTVRCFRTIGNELVSTVVSDANGNYVATTPYADGHYLVVHKAGPPDIAGASVTTLTPA